MNETILSALQWRYATKKYDTSKKISEADFKTIIDSIQLSPSAFGLQPIKVLLIEDMEVRTKLKEIAFNQAQISDASHVLVFCSYTNLDENYISNHSQLMAETRNLKPENLSGFKNHVSSSLSQMDKESLRSWTAKQAYLALGQLLHTCALLNIDATPMEGFDPKKTDELFHLEDKNLQSVLLCTLGYRDESDPYLQLKKVRKKLPDLFEKI